jgi:hypothetical protein
MLACCMPQTALVNILGRVLINGTGVWLGSVHNDTRQRVSEIHSSPALLNSSFSRVRAGWLDGSNAIRQPLHV